MKNLALSFFMLLLSLPTVGQDNYLRDSLDSLSPEECLHYVTMNRDYNRIVFSDADSTYTTTVFEHLAHGFGYYNQPDTLGIVGYMVTHSKERIQNPYFFLADPAPSKVDTILEYFSLLHDNNQQATLNDFENIINTFYVRFPPESGLDYQNIAGKTVLMYACSFQYGAFVDQLLKEKVNPNLADKSGKTALMYACSTDNKSIIKALMAAGAKKDISDESGKKAKDYCLTTATRKLVK